MAEKFDITKFGKTEVGKFSFKVPGVKGEEGAHAQAGEKINKTFEYQVLSTEDEARKVMEGKKWTLLDLVNEELKSSARSNSYQSATVVYKPTEVSADQIRQRMINDYIRSGASEDFAKQMVDNMLAAIEAQKSGNDTETEA